MFRITSRAEADRVEKRGRRRRVVRRPAVGPRPEWLEGRALLSVTIEHVERLASSSLVAGVIGDEVPLSPAPGGTRVGSTRTLVGYEVPNLQQPPGGVFALDGMALDITLAGVGPAGAKIELDWGDPGTAVNNANRPTWSGGAGPDGRANVPLPHAYTETGTYLVQIKVFDQSNPPAGASPVEAVQITVVVDHVLLHDESLFLRGREDAGDRFDLAPGPGGTVLVGGNVVPSWKSGPASTIYVETLGGDDVIFASPGLRRSLWVDAGSGDDFVQGGAGDNHVLGGDGDDELLGGRSADELFGGPGADRLRGLGGDDRLYGGSGEDDLDGGAGADRLFGDADADLIAGRMGNDFLLGGLGPDVLLAGPGNNVLAGGYDNDVLDVSITGRVVDRALAAWGRRNARAALAALTAPVTFGATDLGAVPFAILRGGGTVVPARDFGPTIANDNSRDLLVGGPGGGRSLIAVSRVAGQSSGSNDVAIAARRAALVVPLGDEPVPTLIDPSGVWDLSDVDTTSGVDLVGHPTRTSYVLGSYQSDTKTIIDILKPPVVASQAQSRDQYGVQRPGTLQVENVDVSPYIPAKFWVEFNRPFLAYGMGFRGIYLVATNPFDPMSLWFSDPGRNAPETVPSRRKELDYLLTAQDPERPDVSFRFDPMRKIIYATS